MTSYEGEKAIERIATEWALHDGTIRSLDLRSTPAGVTLDLVCVPRAESPVRELRLELVGVSRFDFLWSEDRPFYFVPGYTAFVQASGRVYMSLDPYDDRQTTADSRDGGVIEARSLTAHFSMKSET